MKLYRPVYSQLPVFKREARCLFLFQIPDYNSVFVKF